MIPRVPGLSLLRAVRSPRVPASRRRRIRVAQSLRAAASIGKPAPIDYSSSTQGKYSRLVWAERTLVPRLGAFTAAAARRCAASTRAGGGRAMHFVFEVAQGLLARGLASGLEHSRFHPGGLSRMHRLEREGGTLFVQPPLSEFETALPSLRGAARLSLRTPSVRRRSDRSDCVDQKPRPSWRPSERLARGRIDQFRTRCLRNIATSEATRRALLILSPRAVSLSCFPRANAGPSGCSQRALNEKIRHNRL